MQRKGLALGLALLGAAACGRTDAAIVVGGSTLLTQTYADQLQTWLGEGDITLTRIFAKEAGDNALDFHAAADGQGRTFTLIEVLSGSGLHYDASAGTYNFDAYPIGPQIIGGYNPQSWHSSGDLNYTPNDADRDAFLFNLTNTVKQDQKLSTAHLGDGYYQTYNSSGHGPTFGGGNDIHVVFSLSSGYARSYSYGSGFYVGTNPDDILIEAFPNDPGDYSDAQSLRFGAIEVFTIAVAPAANGELPEPAQLVAWTGLTAWGACGAAVRRHRRAS